jgi:cytochrome c556
MQSLPRVLVILSLLIASSVAFAADPAPDAPKDKKPETELSKNMEKMGGAYRKLRRQVGDPAKNADSLELVAVLSAGAEAATKLVPAKAAQIPEADRKQWIADFHAKISDMQVNIGKLEAALKANQNEEAGKIVQALGLQQKEGHQEYRIKEKD